MGIEIDLLLDYPKSKRNIDERSGLKSEEIRSVARQFGREFFDGDRKYGYGGFSYSPRFWQPVVPAFQAHYDLNTGNSLLDIGCAKGFMLHDFKNLIPGLIVKGIDISEYAIENCMDGMSPYLQVGDARKLEFESKSFDLVVSINTVHNLDKDECALSLQEIERVSRGRSFITVDAYRNDAEKERMYAWNLTAKTIMSVEDWKKFFLHVGYTGDYFWFVP